MHLRPDGLAELPRSVEHVVNELLQQFEVLADVARLEGGKRRRTVAYPHCDGSEVVVGDDLVPACRDSYGRLGQLVQAMCEATQALALGRWPTAVINDEVQAQGYRAVA